jgi:hypothetical protein
METKFVYDLILPYFVEGDDSRPILKKVHKGDNGYLYATEGHIAIRVPQEKAMNCYEEVPGFPDVENLIQEATGRDGNVTATIHTNDLIRILAGVAWMRVTVKDKCFECNGVGELTCNRCGNEYECKRCNGKGEVNIRINEYALLQCEDYDYAVKIGLPTYRAGNLQIIALAAQMLQEEHIVYHYRGTLEPAVFSFAGVDILLMPFIAEKANVVMMLK